MDYELYDRVLFKSVFVMGILCIIGIIAFLVLFIYTVKNLNRIEKLITAMILVLLVAIYSAFLISYSYNYMHDIRDKSYIVYNGDVNIDAYGQGIIVYLDNGSIKLTYGQPLFEDGSYYGKVIYSKHSKVLLDCELERR